MRKKIAVPEDYLEFLYELTQNNYRNFVLTGGRGSAKSYTTALGINGLVSKDWHKVLNLRQIQKSMKDSVHALYKQQIIDYQMPGFNVGEKYIRHNKTGSEYLFNGMYQNLTNIKSIPKITIAWLEEAKDFSQDSLDIIIPTVREPNSKLIYTLNPEFETDPVWDMFMKTQRPDTYYLHTTLYDNPYATDDLLMEAELLKQSNYNKWLNVYMGELKQEGDDLVLSIADVKKALERLVDDEGTVEHGVDPARYGDDSSVISTRKGSQLKELKIYEQKSVTQLAGLVMNHVGDNKKELIKIDCGGLGAGVHDILKDKGYNVIEVNFGERAKNADRYSDLISEMWHEFSNQIQEISINAKGVKQKDNDRLKKELSTRKYEVDKKGRFKVESKDKYKKRGYKSPDVADSVLLCFYIHKKSGYFSFT